MTKEQASGFLVSMAEKLDFTVHIASTAKGNEALVFAGSVAHVIAEDDGDGEHTVTLTMTDGTSFSATDIDGLTVWHR